MNTTRTRITDLDLFNAGARDGDMDATRGTGETMGECTGDGETLKPELVPFKHGYVFGFARHLDPDDVDALPENLENLLWDARVWAAKKGIYS